MHCFYLILSIVTRVGLTDLDLGLRDLENLSSMGQRGERLWFGPLWKNLTEFIKNWMWSLRYPVYLLGVRSWGPGGGQAGWGSMHFPLQTLPSLSTYVFLHPQGLHPAKPVWSPRWVQEKSWGQQNEAFSVPRVWVSTRGRSILWPNQTGVGGWVLLGSVSLRAFLRFFILRGNKVVWGEFL